MKVWARRSPLDGRMYPCSEHTARRLQREGRRVVQIDSAELGLSPDDAARMVTKSEEMEEQLAQKD